MTDIFVVGNREESSYLVDFEMGEIFLPIKYDTGAKYTVISARALNHNLKDEGLQRIKEYCETNISYKEQFVSASGDPFWGYLVHAENVRIGSSRFKDFFYYLVVENKRDIALLGFDFLDKCKRHAEPLGNCIMSGFDEVSYKRSQERAMNGNDLIAFIDSL